MSDELIRCVGGPLDGQTYPWSSCRFLVVPEGRDRVRYVASDGYAGTHFGMHTYECQLLMNADGGEDRRWEWIRYESPSGVILIDWAAVESRMESIRAKSMGGEVE